jgi:ATP-dependent RNA helicase DHX37/DHR1
VKKSLLGQSGKRKRHQDIFAVQNAEGDEDLADEFSSGQLQEDREFQNNTKGEYRTPEVGVVEGPPSLVPKSQTALSVGSALQRNANGSVIAPKIRPMDTVAETSPGVHLMIFNRTRHSVPDNSLFRRLS